MSQTVGRRPRAGSATNANERKADTTAHPRQDDSNREPATLNDWKHVVRRCVENLQRDGFCTVPLLLRRDDNDADVEEVKEEEEEAIGDRPLEVCRVPEAALDALRRKVDIHVAQLLKSYRMKQESGVAMPSLQTGYRNFRERGAGRYEVIDDDEGGSGGDQAATPTTTTGYHFGMNAVIASWLGGDTWFTPAAHTLASGGAGDVSGQRHHEEAAVCRRLSCRGRSSYISMAEEVAAASVLGVGFFETSRITATPATAMASSNSSSKGCHPDAHANGGGGDVPEDLRLAAARFAVTRRDGSQSLVSRTSLLPPTTTRRITPPPLGQSDARCQDSTPCGKDGGVVPPLHPVTQLSRGCFYSTIGSEPQTWHTDGPPLCRMVDMPPYAVNVFIPLVPLGPHNGTQFAVGSHRPMQRILCGVRGTGEGIGSRPPLLAVEGRRDDGPSSVSRKRPRPRGNGDDVPSPAVPPSPLQEHPGVDDQRVTISAAGEKATDDDRPIDPLPDGDDDDDLPLTLWFEKRKTTSQAVAAAAHCQRQPSVVDATLASAATTTPEAIVVAEGRLSKGVKDSSDDGRCGSDAVVWGVRRRAVTPLACQLQAVPGEEGMAPFRADINDLLFRLSTRSGDALAGTKQSDEGGGGCDGGRRRRGCPDDDVDLPPPITAEAMDILRRKREEADGMSAYPLLAPRVAVGEALLFDYRVWHRGLGNRGGENRPCVYATYAVPWYRDVHNFGARRYQQRLDVVEAFALRGERQSGGR